MNHLKESSNPKLTQPILIYQILIQADQSRSSLLNLRLRLYVLLYLSAKPVLLTETSDQHEKLSSGWVATAMLSIIIYLFDELDIVVERFLYNKWNKIVNKIVNQLLTTFFAAAVSILLQ